KWYLKAAEQGHAPAQFIIGVSYYSGKGVIQNIKQAYIWNSLAATNGVKEAIEIRNFLANELSPSALDEAQESAAKLYKKINSVG
ncbi:MAG: sel1 repeat family protein, partial [Thalassotalea sp.]|nr:sel1 repeat family protein [Thalassotalea sp.]